MIKATTPTNTTAASADTSLPDPSLVARLVLIGLGIVAVALADVANALKWDHAAFLPSASKSADFGLFAGFYIGAQVIERVGELVAPLLPPWGSGADAATVAHGKPDRAVLMLGVTFVAGVLLSFASGLYFMSAAGFHVSRTIDVAVTGLVLAGGTTTLHNLLSFAQNQGNPPTTKST